MLRLVASTGAVVLMSTAFVAASSSDARAQTMLSPTPAAYDWSGFYAGGFFGTAEADVDVTDLFTDSFGGVFYTPGGNPFGFPANGLLGGAQAGYDWQWGGFVAGVVGEVGVMNLDNSIINPFALPVPLGNELPVTSFESEWFGSLTGRVGYTPLNRLLVYAKGGVAFLDAEGSTVDTCGRSFCQQTTIDASGEEVLVGWTIGGGVEAAVAEHVRIGVEYRFYDFESFEVSGVANNFLEYHQNIELDGIHTARAFINYVW
jgi:outer membrane immunogenic protein